MIEKFETGIKFTIKLVCIVVIIGGVNNIASQLSTVNKARIRNEETKTEVSEYRQKNIELLEKISYATSSAFVDQALRSYFGVGGKNDYWLILPSMEIEQKASEASVVEAKSNMSQWLDLFTKGL